MDIGEFWTRWTVRLAMALYVFSLLMRIEARGRFSWLGWSRAGWSAGCLAYLLHVVCAFTYYHDWSHAQAYEATARQTEAAVGVHWGGGLYANYLFTMVWLTDAALWPGAESYRRRSRLTDWLVQGFMGFMAFNATVVFASGYSRWFGVLSVGLLLATSAYQQLGKQH